MYNLNSKGKNILFVYKIKSVIYLPRVNCYRSHIAHCLCRFKSETYSLRQLKTS